MIRQLFFLTVIIITFVQTAAAQDAPDLITVDMAQDYVDITTDFEGGPVYVFGTIDQPGDIVMVLRGPQKNMTVRQKKQVLGAWMNRQSVSFRNVPSYYSLASSGDIDELLSPALLKEHQLDLRYMNFDIVDAEKIAVEMQDLFADALLRNKQDQGLYHRTPGNIIFLNDGFFRATFYLPPNVPVGDFALQTFFVKNGQVYDIKTNKISVAQVGLSSRIYEFSREQSLVYGVLCVLLAVFSGWFSNRIRRSA